MKKVLIVTDVQNDYVYGFLGTPEAQAVVPGIKEKAENFDGEVIFTMDTRMEDYKQTMEGILHPEEHCIVGTDGWEIVDELMDLAYGTMDEMCSGNCGSCGQGGCAEGECENDCDGNCAEGECEEGGCGGCSGCGGGTEALAPLEKATSGSLDLSYILLSIDDEDPIESIEMVGVRSDISILANAVILRTVLPNTPLIIDSALCAGTSPEAQNTAFAALKKLDVLVK